jgi:hypothetical protein
MIAAIDRTGDQAGAGPDGGGVLVLVFAATAAPGESDPQAARFVEAAGRRPCLALVVQDRDRSGFYRGAVGLGASMDQLAAALRTLVSALRPARVVACGAGAAGHAAMVHGILLGASRIVVVEPPAHLIADELALYHDSRWEHALDALPDPAEARRFDVSALLEQSAFDGEVLLLLGTRRGNDHHDAVHQNSIHAHRLARSNRVALCPFPETEHDPLGWLWRQDSGQGPGVLSRYLFDAVPEAASWAQTPDPAPVRATNLRRRYPFKYQLCPIDSAEPGDLGEPGSTYAMAGDADSPAPEETARRQVDDGWRQWIAGNLMLGASPVDLEETLVAHGISRPQANREVRQAIESPYLWGAQRLRNRLNKLDWLLASYRKLRRLDRSSSQVDRRHRLPLDELVARYCAGCRPVIVTGLAEVRPSAAWTLDTLAGRLGDQTLTVSLHPASDPQSSTTLALTAAEFVARLRQAEDGAEASDGASVILNAGSGSPNPSGLDAVWADLAPLPGYVASVAYRHGSLQVASAGSIISLQLNPANVLRLQVLGETALKLAPAWDLPLLRPAGALGSDLDGRTFQPSPSPPPDQPQVLECHLEPGDILFLPAGWWSFAQARGTSAALTFTGPADESNDASEHLDPAADG